MRSSTRSATSRDQGEPAFARFWSAWKLLLSVTCLIAGGLLLHSFINVLSVDNRF